MSDTKSHIFDPPGHGLIGGHYFRSWCPYVCTSVTKTTPTLVPWKQNTIYARTLAGAWWVILNLPDLFSLIVWQYFYETKILHTRFSVFKVFFCNKGARFPCLSGCLSHTYKEVSTWYMNGIMWQLYTHIYKLCIQYNTGSLRGEKKTFRIKNNKILREKHIFNHVDLFIICSH